MKPLFKGLLVSATVVIAMAVLGVVLLVGIKIGEYYIFSDFHALEERRLALERFHEQFNRFPTNFQEFAFDPPSYGGGTTSMLYYVGFAGDHEVQLIAEPSGRMHWTYKQGDAW